MSMHDHSHSEGETEDQKEHDSFLTSRAGLVFIGFAIIAGALLFTEHRAHVLGYLIWLPLFACLFMHMFMHHGHGGHGDHDQQSSERKAP